MLPFRPGARSRLLVMQDSIASACNLGCREALCEWARALLFAQLDTLAAHRAAAPAVRAVSLAVMHGPAHVKSTDSHSGSVQLSGLGRPTESS